MSDGEFATILAACRDVLAILQPTFQQRIQGGGKWLYDLSDCTLRVGEQSFPITPIGTHSPEPVDYPLFIRPAAEAVARGETERGIVLGGSGNGEAIVANKVKGIRCALCWNLESARLSRQHNDANVLSLGQRMIPLDTALDIVKLWLNTSFEGGRHLRRIREIEGGR